MGTATRGRSIFARPAEGNLAELLALTQDVRPAVTLPAVTCASRYSPAVHLKLEQINLAYTPCILLGLHESTARLPKALVKLVD